MAVFGAVAVGSATPSCAEVELTGEESSAEPEEAGIEGGTDEGGKGSSINGNSDGSTSTHASASSGSSGSPAPTTSTTNTTTPPPPPPPPPAAGCADGVTNGTETDIDCGGASCGKCASGKTCSLGTDCASGACVGSRCVHQVSVGVSGMSFAPAALTIKAGDTVRFTWVSNGHNVTGGVGCGQPSGGWCSPADTSCANAPTQRTGFTYDHTFSAAGSYPYYCSPHCSMMKATITVVP